MGKENLERNKATKRKLEPGGLHTTGTKKNQLKLL